MNFDVCIVLYPRSHQDFTRTPSKEHNSNSHITSWKSVFTLTRYIKQNAEGNGIVRDDAKSQDCNAEHVTSDFGQRNSSGKAGNIRGCIKKFPDWSRGTRTANDTALCH